jgi:hypothetical protein
MLSIQPGQAETYHVAASAYLKLRHVELKALEQLGQLRRVIHRLYLEARILQSASNPICGLPYAAFLVREEVYILRGAVRELIHVDQREPAADCESELLSSG